jgi:hypothetical protein
MGWVQPHYKKEGDHDDHYDQNYRLDHLLGHRAYTYRLSFIVYC